MLTLKKMMIDFYNEHAYTHEYIFGFIFNHKVYAVNVTSEVLNDVLKLDKASRGQGYALRYRPNKDVKEYLMTKGAEVICSELYLNQLCSNCKYNKGEVFEMLITEANGQEWEKDSVPFTDDGDLTVNGVAYQIKFEGASFINEGQIRRMK